MEERKRATVYLIEEVAGFHVHLDVDEWTHSKMIVVLNFNFLGGWMMPLTQEWNSSNTFILETRQLCSLF